MSTVPLEKLEFVNGKFLLTDVSTPKLRAKLSKNSYWLDVGNDSYETDNLGAASALKRFATEGAKSVLTRAFQEHYGDPMLPPLPLLDPHQREGLKWVLSRKRSYLAHAPGAGKTCVAILAACLAEGKGQSIFIVPPGLVLNWEREILKFTEWLGLWPAVGIVGRSDSQDYVPWRADFIIVPDSMLTKVWVYRRLVCTRKKVIAVDEASRFKESTTERSIAFYGGTIGEGLGDLETVYPGLFQRARHAILLDGSPMPNRPMELWAPTYALHPEAIGCMTRDDFGNRYCGPTINDYGQREYLHSSHEDELREKLQKDFMHVVTEDQLSHPERRRAMLFMDEDVRTVEHKTWERKHLDRVVFEDDSQGAIARYRRELGLRKVPWVARYVRERLKTKGESILIFAWHRDVCMQLKDALEDVKWRPFVIIGGVNAQYREQAFTQFQNGASRLLILNILAGGRGHNLQRADRAVFAEWSWSDETNRQAEKRASRKGSDKEFLRCDYIVCPGSMDERQLGSVFTKQKRVRKIIG